jgi:peroxiredoxin Q/BCP
MPMLTAGQAAPPFSLPNQDGKTVKLEDFKGKNVIFWFYPKADTPG